MISTGVIHAEFTADLYVGYVVEKVQITGDQSAEATIVAVSARIVIGNDGGRVGNAVSAFQIAGCVSHKGNQSSGRGLGISCRQVAVVLAVNNTGLDAKVTDYLADTSVRDSIELGSIVGTALDDRAVIGRGCDTRAAAKLDCQRAVVYAVRYAYSGIVFSVRTESGDSAIHCSVGAVCQIGATVSIDRSGYSTILNVAVKNALSSADGAESEAGDAADGETFAAHRSSGRSDLAGNLHILDCTAVGDARNYCYICGTACREGHVGLDGDRPAPRNHRSCSWSARRLYCWNSAAKG